MARAAKKQNKMRSLKAKEIVKNAYNLSKRKKAKHRQGENWERFCKRPYFSWFLVEHPSPNTNCSFKVQNGDKATNLWDRQIFFTHCTEEYKRLSWVVNLSWITRPFPLAECYGRGGWFRADWKRKIQPGRWELKIHPGWTSWSNLSFVRWVETSVGFQMALFNQFKFLLCSVLYAS